MRILCVCVFVCLFACLFEAFGRREFNFNFQRPFFLRSKGELKDDKFAELYEKGLKDFEK